jgi:ketosteroid isomerase-like protein
MGGPDPLAAIEARTAIRRLALDYAQAFAALDLDALLALYLPELELRAHFAVAMRELHTAVLLVGAHPVQLTGPDRATGTVQCHVDVLRRDGGSYRQDVVYTDEYARRDGRWYFAGPRRHELVQGTAPGTRPNLLPPADWPRSQVGRGTWPPGATDRHAFLTLGRDYAAAVDRRDAAALRALFAAGAEVVVPAELTGGPAAVIGDPGALLGPLAAFERTEHQVLGLDAERRTAADTASGTVHAIARHFYRRRGEYRVFTVGLRYLDTYTLSADGWRFARRVLVADRTDRSPVPRRKPA